MDEKELKTFFVNTETGTILVNGEEIKKVTTLTLVFENGRYGLAVTRDEFFKAEVPIIQNNVEIQRHYVREPYGRKPIHHPGHDINRSQQKES